MCQKKITVFLLTKYVQLLVVFMLPYSFAKSLDSEFDHFAWLDESEQFGLYWSVQRADKSIHFAAAVKTTGWIGFGISKGLSGKMPETDIAIGWVTSNGQGYLEVSWTLLR